ncbi:MAG TPA: hypothetical protein VKM00_06930 [Luteimonas sp.]|nr:hypothetical protein [Luteimonas sp.]
MPGSLKSFEEFDQLLATARIEVDAMHSAEPDDGAISSVKRQLEALHGWTRNGRCPSQAEKDQLNFGQIASRVLDNYPVADSLFELSSYVIYWEAPPDAL